MAIQTTDVSLGLSQLKRIRTQNYRGSLVSSVITLDKAAAVNDTIALMPIKPGAVIHSIVLNSGAAFVEQVSLGVQGIRSMDTLPVPAATGWGNATLATFDRTAAEGGVAAQYGTHILRALAATVLGANSIDCAAQGKTIHELLCWGPEKTPIASYAPYKDGLLMLVMSTAAAIAAGALKITIQHVDPSPVGSCLTEVVSPK